jgi:hypothetical protein
VKTLIGEFTAQHFSVRWLVGEIAVRGYRRPIGAVENQSAKY